VSKLIWLRAAFGPPSAAAALGTGRPEPERTARIEELKGALQVRVDAARRQTTAAAPVDLVDLEQTNVK